MMVLEQDRMAGFGKSTVMLRKQKGGTLFLSSCTRSCVPKSKYPSVLYVDTISSSPLITTLRLAIEEQRREA